MNEDWGVLMYNTLRIPTGLGQHPYNRVAYDLPLIGKVKFYFYTNFLAPHIHKSLESLYTFNTDTSPSIYFGFDIHIGSLDTTLLSLRLVPNVNYLEITSFSSDCILSLSATDYPTLSTIDDTAYFFYRYLKP